MFSICIATLNNAELLQKALYCISYSQRQENQVVIYDNDSTDNTEEIVNLYADHSKWKGLDIDYRKGPNISQYHALDDCYSRAKYDLMFRIHTDMRLCIIGWEDYFLRAIKKAAHPWKWLMCARSIEPIKGHTEFHIIRDYSMSPGKTGPVFCDHLFDDFIDHKDNTIVTGYREPFLMHKKLYEGFDKEAMLTYKAYCGDDHTVQQAYHLGVRQFWMVNGVLLYHMVGPKGGQTNTSKDNQDKDENWPYKFFVKYWKEKGYKDARHPGQWHPELIPQYIEV